MRQKALILTVIMSALALLIGSYSSYLLDSFKIKNLLPLNKGDVSFSGQGDIQNSIIKAIENSKDKVVSIIPESQKLLYEKDPFGYYKDVFKNNIGGSGIFVSDDGKIITNAHIIDKNEDYIVITSSGEKYSANILEIDEGKDIATLKIKSKSKFPYFKINSKNNLKVGTFVIAIGNVGGNLNNSASFGIISGLNREIKVGDRVMKNLIQTDASINPGNSGGALIDLEGNLVGINSYVIEGINGVGFTITFPLITNH